MCLRDLQGAGEMTVKQQAALSNANAQMRKRDYFAFPFSDAELFEMRRLRDAKRRALKRLDMKIARESEDGEE